MKVKVVGSGVGGITETDATLAAASNAIVLGFNVRADASARRIIENENIDLRYYSIIYELLNEIKAAMSGMLQPEFKRNYQFGRDTTYSVIRNSVRLQVVWSPKVS